SLEKHSACAIRSVSTVPVSPAKARRQISATIRGKCCPASDIATRRSKPCAGKAWSEGGKNGEDFHRRGRLDEVRPAPGHAAAEPGDCRGPRRDPRIRH